MRPYPVLSLILLAIILVSACTTVSLPTPVVGSFKSTPASTDISVAASPDSTSETALLSATPTLLAAITSSTPTSNAITEASCAPTLAGDLGPEYVWQVPVRSSVGQGHVLRGVVRSSLDCSPISQAKLEFWLAGPDGQYDDDHRATLFADQRGGYRFESNFPGQYPERPIPHIHLYVSANGYRGLITEYHPSQGQREGTLDLVLVPEDPLVKVVASDESQRPLISVTGQIAFHTQRDGPMEIYGMKVEDALQGLDSLEPVNLTNNPAEDMFPVWSPDGSQIAFASDRNGNWEIYAMKVDGSDVNRLTNNSVEDWAPAWSPDGSSIAFSSQADIWLMKPDGSNPINLTNSPAADDLPAWSPDGTRLAFTSENQSGNWEIYILDIKTALQEPGNLALIKLTNNPAEDSQPVWSPDGAGLAFKSSRDGNYEIYAVNADGSGLTRLTDNPGGDGFPTWRSDHN